MQQRNRRSLTRSACLVLLVIGLVVVFPQARGDTYPALAETPIPPDVTFEGDFGHVIKLPAKAGGGTVSLTFTEDLTGITRAEVDGFTGMALTSNGVIEIVFSRELYFSPPVPIADGAFSFALPGALFGTLRDGMKLEGKVISETEAAGTGVWCAPSCLSFPEVPWTAGGPVDTPPGQNDTLHVAQLEDGTGKLALTVDGEGHLTSFSLKGVTFQPCVERAVSIRAFFDPPRPLEDGAFILLRLEEGLFPMSVSDVERSGDRLSGSLVLLGFYQGDCQAVLDWSISGFFTTPTVPAPTVQATPTAPAATAVSDVAVATAVLPTSASSPTPQVAALPSAGGGGGRSGAVPVAALLLLSSGVLAAGLGVALRARGGARD